VTRFKRAKNGVLRHSCRIRVYMAQMEFYFQAYCTSK
jgi:hypothetical protein